MSTYYTEGQIAFIIGLKLQGMTYEAISKKFNTKFGATKSEDNMRHVYRTHKNHFGATNTEVTAKSLLENSRLGKNHAIAQRQNKILIESLDTSAQLLSALEGVVKAANLTKIQVPKVTLNKHKPDMTLELMLSDIHYGKKTDTFDLKVCRERIREVVAVTLEELEKAKEHYSVSKIILALLGDIIESFSMHGLESAAACELGNMEQIQSAIESLFYDVVVPLAKTGLEIQAVCITGNHDRTETNRTYVTPGRSNVTWVIYNMLKMLSGAHGLKNVTFTIPEGPYAVVGIYGFKCLYEHGDQKGISTAKQVLTKHLANRSRQVGEVLHFLRIGHFHEYTCYGRGEIIINDSVPGPDGYSDAHGYNSHAGQTLNFYIATKERPNCFYKSFPIYLK